ncbi:ECF-type sigma factor [Maioricimonas rarisocia]|nr:ECF-type sigma factor [Maioricimonas rarisocia]
MNETSDARGSDDQAAETTRLRLLMAELRQLADVQLTGPGQPLRAKALVEEAFARQAGVGGNLAGTSRLEFLSDAARAMRRVLVEIASRGPSQADVDERPSIELLDDLATTACTMEQLLRLEDALHRLASEDPQAAGMVERRFFAGMSVGDAGTSLRLPRALANQAWAYGRAWLQCELNYPSVGTSDESAEASGTTRPVDDNDRHSLS